MEDYWIYGTFNECIEHIVGMKFSDLQDEWLHALRHQTANAFVEDVPVVRQESIITRKGVNIFPVLYKDSQNHQHVVYLSSREGFPVIYDQPIYDIKKRRRLARSGQTTDMESVHFLESGIFFNEKI